MHCINNIHVHKLVSTAMLELIPLYHTNLVYRNPYQHTKLCRTFIAILNIIVDNSYQLYDKVIIWWKIQIFTWKCS